MIYLSEILFLVAIAGIADLQARMISAGKTIYHGWWDLVFAVLIGLAWWAGGHNWWLMSALVTEHFVFFPPLLNFLRSPREAFFYLSSQPHKGSIWDWFLLKVEPAYPFIWVAGLVGFGTLQYFLV